MPFSSFGRDRAAFRRPAAVTALAEQRHHQPLWRVPAPAVMVSLSKNAGGIPMRGAVVRLFPCP